MQLLVNIKNTNICTMHRVCISVFNVCNDARQQIVGKLDLENKQRRTENQIQKINKEEQKTRFRKQTKKNRKKPNGQT